MLNLLEARILGFGALAIRKSSAHGSIFLTQRVGTRAMVWLVLFSCPAVLPGPTSMHSRSSSRFGNAGDPRPSGDNTSRVGCFLNGPTLPQSSPSPPCDRAQDIVRPPPPA